jgi:membrane-associated phospholipid phosphatase
MRSSPLSQTLEAPEAPPTAWSTVVEALTRPYPVTASMVVLVLLVPFYIFIAELLPGRKLHVPEVGLDHLLPLRPTWALVYGSLYLFLILLPVLVVRHEEHIRRTVRAYLLVWIAAYVCFLAYPTVAPRHDKIIGQGFGVWGLRFLYSADPPYNCFPSLHVAHSFVSAFTCSRLHRGVGIAAAVAASLVGLSTLYTKQHYVLDVTAGILLACIAYAVFLRGYSPGQGLDLDRRVAPFLAVTLIGLLAVVTACFWGLYQGGVGLR